MKTVQELMNAIVAPQAAAGYGQKAVTTAGTAVALAATATPIPSGLVLIKAKSANTGLIYVGGSAVAAASGFQLSAGEVVYWPATDLSAVYVDSAENGEGVCFVYS